MQTGDLAIRRIVHRLASGYFRLQAGKALLLTLATPCTELGGIQTLTTQNDSNLSALGAGIYLI